MILAIKAAPAKTGAASLVTKPTREPRRKACRSSVARAASDGPTPEPVSKEDGHSCRPLLWPLRCARVSRPRTEMTEGLPSDRRLDDETARRGRPAVGSLCEVVRPAHNSEVSPANTGDPKRLPVPPKTVTHCSEIFDGGTRRGEPNGSGLLLAAAYFSGRDSSGAVAGSRSPYGSLSGRTRTAVVNLSGNGAPTSKTSSMKDAVQPVFGESIWPT